MAGALSLCDTESVIIKVFRKDFHGLTPSLPRSLQAPREGLG
jgi:hypothetical protein